MSLDTIPSWFKTDPQNPSAIFSAWRNLSTREAALFLGDRWTVLGGQLRDKEGKPLALTPLAIHYNAGIRSFGANLMTDGDGYFLIYSPYSLDVRGLEDGNLSDGRFCIILAAPGYPPTAFGLGYAAVKKEIIPTAARTLLKEADRAFYLLTIEGNNTFDERGFEAYRSEVLTKSIPSDFKPFRALPRAREGSTEGRERTVYRLRVVSHDRRPVPHALVKYQAYDGYEGNMQVVETDTAGICEVEEYLLAGKDETYYAAISRIITVDAPGLAVGPVRTSLRKGVLNDVILQTPSQVSGRVTDHRGDPVWMHLSVEYRNPSLLAFETNIPQRADGSFLFNRIMPGEEFRLKAVGSSRQNTPRPSLQSGYMTLSPGEECTISFDVPLAAGLRVLVTDDQGRSLKDELYVVLLFDDGNQRSGILDDSGDGRFGFHALGQVPFKIQVKARGFREYISESVRLKPGELRFVRVTMLAQNR